jgi:surfactin synthase thioesterase subunit/phosphopantetheinyl transferase
MTLFCLPYAGCGASAFRGWATALQDVFDVRPVQLPGRESRWREDPAIDPDAIATAIAAAVSPAATDPDHPAPRYAIYGHSLGGRLGYEVVRRLEAAGAPLPDRLIVSGCQPPELPNIGPLRGVSRESDEVLIDKLGRLGGIAPEVAGSPELLELLLPAIRSDFRWIDDYQWVPGPALQIPITAICGTADGVSMPEIGAGWSRHSAPGFALHTVAGGHFFLHDDFPAVAGILRAGARADPQTTAAELPPTPGQVHLWFGRLIGPDLPKQSERLSERERERALRFRFDRDRDRYVARCLQVRSLLDSYGIPMGRQEIPTTGSGKPYLPGTDITINWSHSAGTVLIGLANGSPIGVDIETERDLPDVDSVADIALHPDEKRVLAAVSPGDRNGWLLRSWTAKEALLKGSGHGLTIEPSLVSFADRQRPERWTPTAAPPGSGLLDWTIHPLRLPGAVASLAVSTPLTGLRVQDLSPGSRPRTNSDGPMHHHRPVLTIATSDQQRNLP